MRKDFTSATGTAPHQHVESAPQHDPRVSSKTSALLPASRNDVIRQAIAAAVGGFCLIVAAGVAAEETGAQPPATGDLAGMGRQVEQGKAYIDRMHKMVASGFSELEEARKSQNITRVNCVNEALTTIKGLMRLAESNFLAMEECVSRKDDKCTEHEYVKISIAFNKAEELDGQLKGCGGPSVDGAIDGRPYIEKNIDPDLPEIDPTEGLTDLAPKLEVVPSASPFIATDASKPG